MDHTRHPPRRAPLITLTLAILAVSCQPAESEEAGAAGATTPSGTVQIMAMHDHTANEHRFQLSAEEVPSGWTTFELVNASPHEHLVQLLKLGDDVEITAQDWIDDVSLTIQEMLFRFHDPDIPLEAVRESLDFAEWHGRWTFMGGPGLIAPGQTARATVNLEPGTYVVECYVKDEDEMMHSSLGMVALLEVTGASAPTVEPEADLEITVSDGGFQVHGHPEAGANTVRVRFEERESRGYRNVSLARLHEDADLNELSVWMNAWKPGGLVAPAPVEFAGGLAAMAAGQVGYFTVHLKPGDHAWVSEYLSMTEFEPDLQAMGWLRTFSVDEEGLNR